MQIIDQSQNESLSNNTILKRNQASFKVLFLGRSPAGRALRYIFFAYTGQKKDAAAIPNAAFEIHLTL